MPPNPWGCCDTRQEHIYPGEGVALWANMCTEGMARAFRGSYPAIGACTLLVCIYVVSISPPLHAEIYSTTAMPINGTLQVPVCALRYPSKGSSWHPA